MRISNPELLHVHDDRWLFFLSRLRVLYKEEKDEPIVPAANAQLQEAYSKFGLIMEDGVREMLGKEYTTTDTQRIIYYTINQTGYRFGNVQEYFREVDCIVGTAEDPELFVEIKTVRRYQDKHEQKVERQVKSLKQITSRRWPRSRHLVIVSSLADPPTGDRPEVRDIRGIEHMFLTLDSIVRIAYEGGFGDTLIELMRSGTLAP